jgi:hypothetical protein
LAKLSDLAGCRENNSKPTLAEFLPFSMIGLLFSLLNNKVAKK